MEKQWYVVNTYSGHENKVKEKLEMRAESMGMQDYIFRVVIPEEKVVEVKDGVTKEKIKKMFPGYILVEMVMTDEDGGMKKLGKFLGPKSRSAVEQMASYFNIQMD